MFHFTSFSSICLETEVKFVLNSFAMSDELVIVFLPVGMQLILFDSLLDIFMISLILCHVSYIFNLLS